jgi:hypothetical protein
MHNTTRPEAKKWATAQEMGHSPWETAGDPEEANNEHVGEKTPKLIMLKTV